MPIDCSSGSAGANVINIGSIVDWAVDHNNLSHKELQLPYKLIFFPRKHEGYYLKGKANKLLFNCSG